MPINRWLPFHTTAKRALEKWNLGGAHLKTLSISENVAFRVDANGQTYVLRIHRPTYHTLKELNSELLWTKALREEGIAAPKPLLTTDGHAYVTLPLPGSNEARNVSILHWVGGELLGNLMVQDPDEGSIRQYFEQLGQIAARIHNQSSGWAIPKGFERHNLDIDGLVGRNPFWGKFWDLPQYDLRQRKLIKEVRLVAIESLSAYAKSPRTYSLIHADLAPTNVVVSNTGLHIIDFDDSAFGWHEYELAVAIQTYVDHPLFKAIFEATVAGYRCLRPLPDSGISRIPLFIIVRFLVSLGWASQRPEVFSQESLILEIEKVCRHSEEFLHSWS
jgi:Ser/Thr protein kinase RdoA (MazF antagonist)